LKSSTTYLSLDVSRTSTGKIPMIGIKTSQRSVSNKS